MAAEQHRLSGLDTAFLCLERDITPMQLGALVIFRTDRPQRPEQIAALLAERARLFPRLGRRVRHAWFPPGAARWVDAPGFRPADHVHLHHLRGQDGYQRVAALASELMARPLRRDRPLWEFHVISGMGDARFAVLVKLHHALGDGLAALEIGIGLLDRSGAAGPGAESRGRGAARDGSRPAAGTAWTRSIVRRMVTKPFRWANGVRCAVGDSLTQAVQAVGMATSVLRSARLPAPGSPLAIMSSGRRDLGLAQLDLAPVRRIRAHFGGTVNDVLLAVVTGALRDWFAARGHPVEGLSLRALVPVSRRARATGHAGANEMSGYLCELPVGEPDPGRRLQIIRTAMERSKAAGSARGPGAIPLLAERLPAAVHRVAAPVAGQVAALLFDVLVTSVPVPGIPLRLAGAELEALFPIAPLAPGHALGVAMSCYRKTAYLGLHADREALPDVQGLAEAAPAALARLARCVPDPGDRPAQLKLATTT